MLVQHPKSLSLIREFFADRLAPRQWFTLLRHLRACLDCTAAFLEARQRCRAGEQRAPEDATLTRREVQVAARLALERSGVAASTQEPP